MQKSVSYSKTWNLTNNFYFYHNKKSGYQHDSNADKQPDKV